MYKECYKTLELTSIIIMKEQHIMQVVIAYLVVVD